MDKIFSSDLFGREVKTITGRTVGVLKDFVINTEDGTIKYLLISTEGNVVNGPHKVDKNGRLIVETCRIRVEENRLIIN